MNLITVDAGHSRLLLAPEVGGSVAGWTRRGMPMMRPLQPDAAANGARDLASYPLFPYSNRVANRRFRFGGCDYELPDLLGGFAIHGAGWQLPWVAIQDGATATILLDHGADRLWPFDFRAEQRFTLTPDRLVCDLRIENRHDRPAPAGFGLHPYFPRSPDSRLEFTAEHVWHNGTTDMIPVRRSEVPPEWDHRGGRAVGSVTLDNCFAGWGGHASISYPDLGYRLDISAEPVFRHLVVYIPPGQDFFAVEPVSNMNDGLNRMDGDTDHGVFVLAPGESRTGRITYSVADL